MISDAFDALSSRRLLLFGGKGGVGKTTVSVAAALHFAATKKTILFTTDPASNLGDIFSADGGGRPENLTIEALNADELYAKFLKANLAQFLELGDRGTYLDKEELRRLFELSIPGVDELMAWMRIGELAEENGDAMIVVDTAPTGHTLRMVGAAHHFRQLAVALDTMQEKHRGLVRQFTRRNVRDELDAFLDRFAAEAQRRRDVLTDKTQSAFVPVFLAEPWVIDQTIRLIEEVRGEGMDVPLAILNRAQKHAEVGVPVFEAPRACVPLDTPAAIREWSAGTIHSRRPAEAGPTLASGPLHEVRRLTFLAGKGGVGKTTSSASIALQLAQRSPDKQFTVISVDPAHSLRDVFEHEKPPGNLTVETIDTRAKWRRFRESIGDEIERAIGALTPSGVSVAYDTEAIKQLIEIAPPGADELFAIDRLTDLIADDKQAGIIVDTAPTGHFLRLLDLPKAAGEWVREFMRILLHYRDLIPAGSLAQELIRASKAMHSMSATLQSSDCEVVVVTRPERVVVSETKRLIADVERRGIHVGGVIANYVTPEGGDACDQSIRSFEAAALDSIGRELVIVERRAAPVIALADLASLVPLDFAR